MPPVLYEGAINMCAEIPVFDTSYYEGSARARMAESGRGALKAARCDAIEKGPSVCASGKGWVCVALKGDSRPTKGKEVCWSSAALFSSPGLAHF